MNKRISKNKVQRMRNLVTGNYGDKTQQRTGYRKYNKKYKEGDVWEENGKTWTIKNGIKQNKTKLKKARQIRKIPLACPKCNTTMKASQHKFMYRHYGHCLYCQTKAESEMWNNGTYYDWLVENVEKNFAKWKKDKKSSFEEWFKEINSKKQITESGMIEDWSEIPEHVKNDIIKRFEKYISDEEEKMKKLIKEEIKQGEKL